MKSKSMTQLKTNLLGGFVVIVFGILCTNVCYSEFRECFCTRQDWSDNLYVPNRQLWSHNLSSADDKQLCSVYCMTDEACVSFYFNNMTYVCSGHSIVLANLTHAEDEPGNSYYTMDCRATEYIGTDCETDDDCATVNSECDDGFCECMKGHAFWPSNRTCVTECTTGYGDDYSPVEYRSIIGNNNAAVPNSTIEECKELCSQATDFVCRTFDFWFPFNYCLMSNETRFTVPTFWQWDNTARHFVRDCD